MGGYLEGDRWRVAFISSADTMLISQSGTQQPFQPLSTKDMQLHARETSQTSATCGFGARVFVWQSFSTQQRTLLCVSRLDATSKPCRRKGLIRNALAHVCRSSHVWVELPSHATPDDQLSGPSEDDGAGRNEILQYDDIWYVWRWGGVVTCEQLKRMEERPGSEHRTAFAGSKV